MNGNRKKTKKKATKFFKYFTLSFVLLFSVIIVAYTFAIMGKPDTPQPDNQQNNNQVANSDRTNNSKPSLIETLFKTKQFKLNVAVFGVDEQEVRTDVMIVASFDSKTKKINLLSIPRDTKVTMTDKMINDIKTGVNETGSLPNWSGVCKINEVHAWAGKGNRNEYSVMQLEDLLGIKIDYFVKVNLDAFKKIVEIVDGVDVDVPRKMSYDDPVQGLHIHLEPGMQHLGPEEAEGLVRWRKNNNGGGYAEGDVGRIETQQVFLKALAEKVLDTNTILSNIPQYIKLLWDYVETDIGIDDALKYSTYITDIDPENIIMETLPGDSPDYKPGETSYFIHDPVETRALVDKIFYDIGESETQVIQQETMSSKNKKIEVLNGGAVGGLAGKTRTKLQQEGFNVVSIGDYTGTRQQQTVIIVNEDGLGEDLKKYFGDTKIEVNSSKLSDDTDIQIILGTGEK